MRARDLLEAVDIEPRVKIVRDGKTTIDYPPNSVREVQKECWVCKGTGKEWVGTDHEHTCDYCDGKTTIREFEYDYPRIGVSNYNLEVICQILGIECDGVHGWIEPESVPAFIKRLLIVKNNGSDFSRPSFSDQSVHMDKSGDIPEIKRGPQMIDLGVDPEQAARYVDTLLAIFIWAKQNGTGVGWA